MAKREQHRSEPQAHPTLPRGHFNHQGESQGKQTGAVRKSPDAYNEQRREEKRK